MVLTNVFTDYNIYYNNPYILSVSHPMDSQMVIVNVHYTVSSNLKGISSLSFNIITQIARNHCMHGF